MLVTSWYGLLVSVHQQDEEILQLRHDNRTLKQSLKNQKEFIEELEGEVIQKDNYIQQLGEYVPTTCMYLHGARTTLYLPC